MASFLYWLAFIAVTLGLGTLLLKLWPKALDIADEYAPDADWPALTVAGLIVLALWSMS